MKTKAILLFDGQCNLCNGIVRFVIQRDPQGYFRFVALQSETGQKMVSAHFSQTHTPDSLVLIEDAAVYVQSDATLRIFRRIQGGWPLLYGLIVLPRFLRDAAYRCIARHRYRWFGKRETCMTPTPDITDRFLP